MTSNIRILMMVTAKQTASHRTKSRVRDHGPIFEVVDQSNFNGAGPLFNRECLLLHSPSGWHGWVPVDEITAIKRDAAALPA